MMKTIAVTMDEDTLGRLDRLTSKSDRARSRSALVRQAVREFADRHRRQTEEERERAVLRKHRDDLHKEAVALVRAQAEP